MSNAKLKCKTCGNGSFTREYHTASSDLACTSCGSVMEENPIVSEVTFAENAAGAATVQGSFLSSDQAHVNFGNGRGSLESREQTLANGKRRIKNVALALGIPDFVSDAAYQWFQLALTNNFVQGRRSQNVVAACLYVACRREKTHHMLIDFSTRLQVSVYAIGATFLKMVKALHITKLPLIDPSLFIQHFADKLDFGKAKLKVISDAVKLAHRMGDDWILEGRRPAGIAGACLLLASRMNNFRRTHTEIMAVTHIGAQTIQKRLVEFKDTDASKLSVNEFRETKEISPSLPPSFKKGKKITKKRKRDLQELNQMEEKMQNDPILGALLEDSEITEDEIQFHIKRLLKRKEKESKRLVNSRIKNIGDGNSTKIVTELEETDDEDEEIQLTSKSDEKLLALIEKNRPINISNALPTTSEILSRIPDDDDLGDVDDDELDNMLLSQAESMLKERLWVGTNQEYLLQQEQKRLKEEADKIAGHAPTSKRKSKKDKDEEETFKSSAGTNLASLVKANLTGSASASDSAKHLLNSKLMSKKINYSAVNNLFDD